MNTNIKRSRVSAEQLSHLVDFLIENEGLAGGKFKKLHGKLESDKKWAELTELLNCLGGSVKTTNQWQTVWKELKSRTSVKVRERKKQQALTGNRPLTQEALSELERRVVAIIGKEYIEGQETVVENVPLEENLQILLEDGEDIIRYSPSNTEETCDVRWETPTPSTSKRTPSRSVKRKLPKDDGETKKQFLDIANKQADTLKMFADANASNAETNASNAATNASNAATNASNAESIKTMADAVKTMGEGLKEVASAIGYLANVISKILKE